MSSTDHPAVTPLVCVVDFHHHRGPEIEQWIGPAPTFAAAEDDASSPFSLIPYMALPDGAHASEEEYSYFSLVRPTGSSSVREGEAEGISAGKESGEGKTSCFGMSCCRQIPASRLKWKADDVTRSAVQKAVVVIFDAEAPARGRVIREMLGAITRSWFEQRDFRDCDVLKKFQETLVKMTFTVGFDGEQDQYLGTGLRQIVHSFKWQTLVLFKCLLLQPKMLFFGSQCEQICQVQFTLISLIPGLIRALGDCADPQLDRYAETVGKPDGVRTSNRASLLNYMGLPLQIFGKGSMFGPYTPLQQLDILADHGTKSYVVGSTNNLLLQQRDRYADVLVNLDDDTVSILSPSLRSALALTTADRRWIDFLAQAVNDTWDESDPSRPNTHGYAGSEEFIRLQFEEYILAMLSAERYHQFLTSRKSSGEEHLHPKNLLAEVEGDPSTEFSATFLDVWRETGNYKLWNRRTDSHLFDIIEPRHPNAGGLTIDDVQRRLAAQVAELHLDERFASTRESVNKRLADGQVRVTSAFNKVWADIEVMREAQRKRAEEARARRDAEEHGYALDSTKTAASSNGNNPSSGLSSPPNPTNPTSTSSSPAIRTDPAAVSSRFTKPDLQQAQATVQAAGQRAGAYFSSWGAWAAEKRKQGWKQPNASTAKAAAGDGQNQRSVDRDAAFEAQASGRE